ncbi:ethanolamine ammonia-lyase reactivating factor EutA, partial [Flavonifractor plautii]|uniref:ethanolamine ammonia-lyase reactivating factor EutA n=1 Tax=Flavonifractor plautii TaxID=292800 RepID=UPI00210CCA20
DIGGGTSNIAVDEKGVLRGTCCRAIGGRLIKVENGRLSYIFPKLQALAAANGISLAVGDRASPEQLYGVCRRKA